MNPQALDLIRKYFPDNAVDAVAESFDQRQIRLEFCRPRTTKLGDFRAPRGRGSISRITLNCNLNPYQMLITYVHELAHYDVHRQYGRKTQPHGKEWKACYTALLQPYLRSDIFPEDILAALQHHLQHVKASSTADFNLTKVLKNYDKRDERLVLVDDLPPRARFKAPNGMVFQKGEKMRKNYRCHCESNGRNYFVSGLLEVIQLD